MTEKEVYEDILNTNLEISKNLLFESELVNKGSRVHDINVYSYKIKELLKDKSLRQMNIPNADRVFKGSQIHLKYLSETFKQLCKYNRQLAAELTYVRCGIKPLTTFDKDELKFRNNKNQSPVA